MYKQKGASSTKGVPIMNSRYRVIPEVVREYINDTVASSIDERWHDENASTLTPAETPVHVQQSVVQNAPSDQTGLSSENRKTYFIAAGVLITLLVVLSLGFGAGIGYIIHDLANKPDRVLLEQPSELYQNSGLSP